MNRRIAVLALVAMMGSTACDHRPSRVVLGIGMARNTHAAVSLAAREINASGGIGGVPIELTGIEWGGSQGEFDPPTVIKWAGRFVNTRELVAVVGHSDSASTLSAAALYNKYGVPQIVTIATNPAITNIGTWTYRLCLSDAAQGPALADYAVLEWKKRRIALVFVNDDYGRALAQLFERRVRELGMEIVASVMHRNTLQDDDKEMIRLALAEMKTNSRPDLIALFQRVNAAVWTVRAVHDAGLHVDILGSDNLAQFSFAESNPALTDGIRVSQFFDLDKGNPRAVKFANDFRVSNGAEPDYTHAFAYDAIYLLKDAVLQGRYTREGVKAYLDRVIREKTPLSGVGGTFTLGPDHDARRPLYIAEIHDRTFRVLKALPAG